MKKQFVSIFSISCVSFAFAANQFIPFTTIEQAQQYCPPIQGLTFVQNNPSIPNSAGMITGNNRILFESTPAKTAIYPKHIAANGLISDAQFRYVEGKYGYISGHVVTCLYAYTTFVNAPYELVLRGK